MGEGMVADSYMDAFPGSLLAVLIYYLEVTFVGLVVVVGNAMYVNCTGDMTTVCC